MSNNYLVFPSKTLRLTGAYTKRAYLYCPCDEMIVTDLCGSSNSINTIWLQSSSKVTFADGSQDYFSMLVIHLDDSELTKLNKGQKFNRGDEICLESDEACSANLFHFAFCKGIISTTQPNKNIGEKLSTKREVIKPENFFFIDSDFTKISASTDLSFKFLSSTAKKIKPQKFEVTASILNVRAGPSTSYPKKTFTQLSKSAQEQIIDLAGFKANGYVKGLVFTALEIQKDWAKSPSGWVLLSYCKPI